MRGVRQVNERGSGWAPKACEASGLVDVKLKAIRYYGGKSVDPPYADTNNEPYAVVRHDREETADLLKAQRGKVAISGFDDEWDGLGWLRHEREKSVNVTKARTRRLEVLWTNYELEPRLIDA